MEIKELIKSRVSLAPMAGITDYVLRSLVRQYSQNCLLTTEMISTEFLAQTLNGRNGTEILERDDDHSPIAYQISGHKPHLIRLAASTLSDRADIIDINMGCPVKKVVNGHDGCALMRKPNLAADLVKAAKDGTDKPVSVKFRLGYTTEELNFVEFGEKMQNAGAEFITIHARTRAQMYSGKANWKLVKQLKESVDIPVFVNGDIVSVETAVEALEESGADGVAIGRGALGDPTLISRIEHYLKNKEIISPPTLKDRVKMLQYHLDEEIKLRTKQAGIKFMRKFYPYYLSGFQHAKQLRTELITEEDYDKIITILNKII